MSHFLLGFERKQLLQTTSASDIVGVTYVCANIKILHHYLTFFDKTAGNKEMRMRCFCMG